MGNSLRREARREGLHRWAERRVWLNLALGYRVVPAELAELSGPTATLRVVLNPW